MSGAAAGSRRGDVRCPRCGGTFVCGAGAPAPCPCTALDLGAPLLAALRQSYTGCLCLGCLHELAAAGDAATAEPQR